MLARLRKVVAEREEGFTLIELLVVMIIIGLLASIAIPVFLNQRSSARQSSQKTDVGAMALDINSVLVDGAATALTITGSSGTYTISGTDANGQAVNVTGKLSTGNSVAAASKYTAGTNTFCVEVDNSSTTVKWKYDTGATGTGVIQTGTCP